MTWLWPLELDSSAQPTSLVQFEPHQSQQCEGVKLILIQNRHSRTHTRTQTYALSRAHIQAHNTPASPPPAPRCTAMESSSYSSKISTHTHTDIRTDSCTHKHTTHLHHHLPRHAAPQWSQAHTHPKSALTHTDIRTESCKHTSTQHTCITTSRSTLHRNGVKLIEEQHTGGRSTGLVKDLTHLCAHTHKTSNVQACFYCALKIIYLRWFLSMWTSRALSG